MLKKIFYIFFPLIIGGIIALIIKDSIDYSILNKPPLSPPKILFPIVWSIIYLLMGISYYLYRKNNEGILIYYIQLFVNSLWSIIFFVLKQRLFAIIWIILLLILIIKLYLIYKNKEKISAYLILPYIIWTMFATYLTIGIYILN